LEIIIASPSERFDRLLLANSRKPRSAARFRDFFAMSPRIFLHSVTIGISLCCAASLLAAPPDQPWFPKAPALSPPSGPVIEVSTVEELFQAAENVPPGGTILLAMGATCCPRS
jgi:hypothetical protein